MIDLRSYCLFVSVVSFISNVDLFKGENRGIRGCHLKYYVSKTVARFDNCVIMLIIEAVLEIYIDSVVLFLYFLKIIFL